VLSRVFKAFEYRDFRLLWFGACTSSIGTWMQIVAQSWLVFDMSKSAFLLSGGGQAVTSELRVIYSSP
jgi:Transmembrane secretion effector